MKNLQVGDRVILNSGGPLMEIEKIADGIVRCFWIVEGEKSYADFKPQMLTRRS